MEFKIDFSNRRVISGIVVLFCIVAVIAYMPAILHYFDPGTCVVNGICQHEQQLNFLIEITPVFVIAGIAIGALVFFFMTSKIEKTKMDSKKTAETLLQFLNKEEKTIVKKILDEKGKIYQSELSRIEGIGKLKSHRILQRLSDRGVIEIEKHGKTNIIKLAKNIRETLVE